MNRILQILNNSDLRCGHDGLKIVAKSNKIDVSNLKAGEFVFFINSKRTQLKAYAAGNVIAHLKTVDGRRLEMQTIKLLPTYFSGGAFKYNEALADLFQQKLKKAS